MEVEMSSTVDRSVPTLAGVRARRDAVLAIARRHGATDVRVFGSVARGEATAASDVDFLVRMEPGRSLLDLGGMLMDLRDLLGVPVDVATAAGLSDRVRDRVHRESVPL